MAPELAAFVDGMSGEPRIHDLDVAVTHPLAGRQAARAFQSDLCSAAPVLASKGEAIVGGLDHGVGR